VKFGKLLVALSVVGFALVPITSMSKNASSDIVVLTAGNTMILNQEVGGESVSAIIEQSKKLDSNLSGLTEGRKKPLYLFLSTPGGSVQAGLELIESLKGLGRPVNTITSFAASMGFQIAQNMDDRLILRDGVLMSHRAAGEVAGSFGGEGPSQMENRQHLWLQRMTEMDEKTVSRTNGKQTLASYQHQYANEMWLTGSESVSQGYADKIVTVKCDRSLDGTTQHNAVIMGIIPVTYDLSMCPLNSSPMNIKIGVETNRGVMDDTVFIKSGGEFGPACLASSGIFKLCALDTSLNTQRIVELKNNFTQSYLTKQRQAVDMIW
jgi:ATP-dependent Clp protease protease subunit